MDNVWEDVGPGFSVFKSGHYMFLFVQMCFEWFTKGQHDLESDVQQQLFKEKILKLEPYEITMNGERLNTDPYSTEAVLKYWKDLTCLCLSLRAASSALGGPTLTHAVTKATKMLTATAMPTVATSVQSPSRYRGGFGSTKLVIIERLLLLAERYVITIEDMYSFPRTILPHGASFNGHPVTLHITYESTKDTFTLEHVSMTMCVDFLFCICQMTMNRDQKLLSQLGFSDEQSLTVKSSGTGTPSGSSESSASVSSSSSSAIFNSAYALEQVLCEYNNAL
ncbi:hypothetical protein XENOCAPTIV_000088 [Xenoophorus captivus]|uniref:UBP34/UBP24/USP9X/USP9Y-like ARM repeat region domain-containing protein n=1 Tax=Xenoophorus captivus TaxID=1517983 RepID=A0ABV0REI9_9TELE